MTCISIVDHKGVRRRFYCEPDRFTLAFNRGRNTVVEHGFLQAKDDNGDIAMAS